MYKTQLIDKVLKSGETIKINIDELTNGSHQKIEVICDVCDIECSVEYISYIKSGNMDIVKSMIINKLHNTRNRIMSRKCEIREINDIDISRDFLNSNHIQGFVGSTSKIGLFYNNELVSLMTFKISVDGVYELNRFCNKINTIVAGGASRLFNYFLKKFECKKIISFSNNSYSNGSLYTKLGFVENKKLKPDYSYIIGDCRIHKFNFRNSNNDNNIKIYDCGKIKFEYNI